MEGDTRTYSCSPGYVIRNVVTLDTTCQPDGKWSMPLFDCLWDCGAPPTVENATVSDGDTVQTTVLTYTCNVGYEVNGTATVTCQANAKWSRVEFSCVPVCPTGWHQISSSCYIVHNTTIPATQIMTFCSDTYLYDTYMLQLETAEENAAVMTYLLPYAENMYCLGLYDVLLDSNRKWMRSNESPSFADWFPGQPNGIGLQPYFGSYQQCSYQWHDIADNYQCSPVCEFSLPY